MMLTTLDPFRSFDRFDRAVGAVLNGKPWTPATNIVEDDAGYSLRFDLPGVAKEDIDISIDKGVLEVTGERRVSSESGDETRQHRAESYSGRFQRSFRLPDDVDSSEITANVKNGVLEIRLHRSAAAKARKVAIADA